MKATVLVDNHKNESLEGEWGLSVLIENNGKKILLDGGQSELFIRNAEGLNVNLHDVDYAVLSHGHYDHANGLPAFMHLNEKAKLYIRDSVAENCYKKKWFSFKYIGIPFSLLKTDSSRLIKVNGNYQIEPGVWLLPHSTQHLETIGKKEKLYRRAGNSYFPDDFNHEQSLVIETEKGLVIFNSCSHGGAANIIREVSTAFPGKEVYAIIGGFHLFKRNEKEVREFARKLKETGVKYVCTGHCTGDKALDVLKQELGDTVHSLQVGLEIEI